MSLDVIEGSTARLFVLFLDDDGSPRIALPLANTKIHLFYTDASGAEELSVDQNNGGGWYSASFSETLGKDFGFYGLYSGAEEGEVLSSTYEQARIYTDPLASITAGVYKLYGRIQINDADASGVRIRIFTSTNNYVRETTSSATLRQYPPDSSKYYNWVIHLRDAGTYIVEFYKSGYLSATWTVVISATSSYFEDLILA